VILLNTLLALLYFLPDIFGALVIEVSNLDSKNISSFQSFFDLFIASVIQSLYSTIISFSSNFNSFSLIIFDIFLAIHKATQPDFIL